jgi:hypothetical protein
VNIFNKEIDEEDLIYQEMLQDEELAKKFKKSSHMKMSKASVVQPILFSCQETHFEL